MMFFWSQWLFPIVIVSLQFWALLCVILIPGALPRANFWLSFRGVSIIETLSLWAGVFEQECLSRRIEQEN